MQFKMRTEILKNIRESSYQETTSNRIYRFFMNSICDSDRFIMNHNKSNKRIKHEKKIYIPKKFTLEHSPESKPSNSRLDILLDPLAEINYMV